MPTPDPVVCGPGFTPRDTSKIPSSELTRGERMIRFIETHCVVPEGDLVGQLVELDIYQKRFILDVYDNPEMTDTAILSIARKNAKTATIAFLVIGHIIGPEAIQNSRIVSGALSRDQASEVYNYASKSIQMSPTLCDLVTLTPSSRMIHGTIMNVTYQAISADGKTAHGKSPIVAILDEVGQIKGPNSSFVDAITTAQGAYRNPLLFYISTQAAEDGDFFSIQIDDARDYQPKKTVCHVYTADPKAKLTSVRAWKAANPALGKFRSREDMEKQAKKAERMPTFENTFRNLNLNQRVTTHSPFVSKSVWEGCGKEPKPLSEAVRLWGGLDLSGRLDLTSLVILAEFKTGPLGVFPYFWAPAIGLKDRAKQDRQPYDIWAKQGWLMTTPGKSVNYEHVLEYIDEVILPSTDAPLASIAFDRWRIDILEKDAEDMGISLPLVPFGQGFKDMGPAIEIMEEKLLNRGLAHSGNPILTMCAANAVAVYDPAGNRKLDKNKATGRIDGVVALAMALGAKDKEPEKKRERTYQVLTLGAK